MERDKLCCFYNVKPLSKDSSILSQVPEDALIVVGKKCICKVEWNGDERDIEYWSNCNFSTLVELCIKEFDIPNASIDSLEIAHGESAFDKEQVIPFSGISDCPLQLQPKSKQIEIIFVTSEGEDPHIYNYDKEKTCQFYFDSFITVFSISIILISRMLDMRILLMIFAWLIKTTFLFHWIEHLKSKE